MTNYLHIYQGGKLHGAGPEASIVAGPVVRWAVPHSRYAEQVEGGSLVRIELGDGYYTEVVATPDGAADAAETFETVYRRDWARAIRTGRGDYGVRWTLERH